MKKKVLSAVLLSFATAAFATLPMYEPFANSVGLWPTGTAYAPGSAGWHQTNAQGDVWFEINSSLANGANFQPYITNFSLSYSGLPASTGNALVLTNGAGFGLRQQAASSSILDSANGSKVYYSMKLQAANVANLSSTGDFCFGVNNGSAADQTSQPSDVHARVYFKKNGTGYQIGISKSGFVQTNYSPTVHTTNETLFIVASYEMVTTNASGATTATNDISRLWVNPTSDTFGAASPPLETVSVSGVDTNEPNGITTFIFMARSTATPNILIVDDFRLGTNWAFATGAAAVKTPPPATTNISFGSTLSLTNKATGASTLAYQWQLNGSNLPGATTSVLSLPNIAATNNGTYSAIVSTGIGATLTNSSVVTVINDPQVTTPGNLNVPPNGSGTFSVSAQGSVPLTYQWLENGTPLSDGTNVSGTVFSGALTAALTLSAISSDDSGASFTCIVSNVLGNSATSGAGFLTVQNPVVVSGPNNATTNYLGTVNYSVAVAGTAPFTFQWLYNGSPLTDGSSPSGSGATITGSLSSNLTVSGVTYVDTGGNYSVMVSNAIGASVISPSATLAVVDPYIATQPIGLTNAAGSTSVMTVNAAGSPTLNYAWYQNGGQLADGSTVPGGGTISGSSTASLTITGVTDANVGNYYVTVFGGSGAQVNSSTNKLAVVNPIVIVNAPKSLVERAGDHVGFSVGVTGTTPSYQWQLNGSNIPGATKNSLAATNIQANAIYTAVVTNLFSTNSASATLTVINSAILPLSATNVIVARVGDGAQTLSGATGNTIYLDQYTPNGTYVNTAQVPDEGAGQPYGTGSATSVFGSPALIAQGAGTDAPNGVMLTLSGGNQQFLNFAGYCEQYPFSGSDVTIGANAGPNWRGFATINAFGVYNLAYTNTGFYSGGNHTIRAMVTLEGTNFWAAGQASSGGIKYASSAVPGYASGNNIPTITSSAAGAKMVQLVGGNLIFSDGVSTNSSAAGLYASSGLPEPIPGGSATSTLILHEGGLPNDFAFSPDGQTVYIADSGSFQGTFSQGGGIQRWDTNNSSGWNYSYTLPAINGLTNGAVGLAVSFPASVTNWGSGVNGAVLYVTSFGATTNCLTQIVDNGSGSTPTLIATAGINQALRGVRFGPAAVPVSIVSQPQSQTNFPGNNVTLSVGASGSQPIYYQWQFNGNDIVGATQSTFSTNNVTFGNSGSYTVIVSNLVPSSVTSATAVLTVTAGAPGFASGVPSFTESAGDHLAFTPVITGSQPIAAQWYLNNIGNPIAGATNVNLVLTNIQTSQSGNYILYISNIYGTNQSSGTLTVTVSPPPLSSNNLVVARIGDGVQPLSGATGNTLYLDQYTTVGSYVSSIQITDEAQGYAYGTGSLSSANQPFGSQALLVVGGNVAPYNDAPYQGFLTRSADGQTLNFAGYCDSYPFLGPDMSVGSNGGPNWRGIGSVGAFGAYSIVFTNTGLYSGGGRQIHAAVSLDQTNYWTAGEAGNPSIKYVTSTNQPASGTAGIISVAGSPTGTRVVQIVNGNLVFSDPGATPGGLYQVTGLATNAATASLLITETNSPMDFAFSPDSATVYIADNGTFTGTSVPLGGLQRWDADTSNGGYTNSYTLGTGTGSTAGARGLTVDFSAQTTWGAGVNGAILYATTAEPSGNRLLKIVDNGSGSAAVILANAAAGSILAGVRFGPSAAPVSISAQPQNQITLVGGIATFSVGAAGTGPIYYQWQLNGVNLPGATQSTLTVSNAQTAVAGSYTVIVSNAIPSTATSAPASIITMLPVLNFNTNGAGWSMNSTAGSGLPVYQYNGSDNVVELTQGISSQASSTFFHYPVYVGGFLATWTYQVINPAASVADGMTFVVQNDPRGAAALGNNGGNLGFTGITPSFALEFNIYKGVASGVGISFNTNGTIGPNTSVSPVGITNGNPIAVTLSYLNGVATVTLLDTVTADTFTGSAAVNIPSVVGGNNAYVGFTAADGGTVSTQTVSNFVFTSLTTLSTASAAGNSLVFTWPSGVGGYTLQQNSDLGTTNWVDATNIVTVVNGLNQTTVSIGATNTFYRLVVP